MKKVFYILAAAALCMVSCSKELSKSDVEAGFDALKPLPTVTIESVGDYDPLTESLLVNLKYTGVAGLDNLSMGVLVSTDPTFKESTFLPIEAAADGSYAVDVPGTELEKNYIMGVAASNDGTAYSDVTSYDFPKGLPWYTKIPGTFTGKVVSYTGKSLDWAITIIADEEDPENKCIVANLDPYFASYGFVAEVGFQIFEAIVDAENHQILVPSRQLIGYEDVYLEAYNSDDFDKATAYSKYIYLSLDKSAKSLVVENAFGPSDSEGLYDVINGGTTLKRQK